VSALSLDRISVSLGGALVVDHLSAQIGDGEWVALIGPNGAGKTTALRAIAGLISYDGGVRLFGHDARTLPRKQVARRIALVPQVPLLPGDITVREYVLLGRTPYLSYLGSERRADHVAADAAIEQLDLGSFASRRLDTLSGGERQRLKLAIEMSGDTGVYVLDEPTTGLHMQDVDNLIGLLDRLVEAGRTVIVIEHNLDVVARADWVIDMGPGAGHDGGRLVFEGLPAELARADGSLTGLHLRRRLEPAAVGAR
jgi:iron complex transport system ATP-binding protein